MDLGRYEIETYTVSINGQQVQRQRIIYIGNNDTDIFVERYTGAIRDGYKGANLGFKNIEWTDIKTHVVGESVVIFDKSAPPKPLIYLTLASIESIQIDGGNKLTIIDSQIDPVTLEFASEFDYNQSYSILNYLLQNPNLDINSLVEDTTPPTVYFWENFYSNPILIDGNSATGPWSTDDSATFSVAINWSTFTGPQPITKSDLINETTGLIYTVTDNREGNITLIENDVKIYQNSVDVSNLITQINTTGTYYIKIGIKDLGQNLIEPTVIMTIV